MSKKSSNRNPLQKKRAEEPVLVDKEDFETALRSYAGDVENNGRVVLWSNSKIEEAIREVEEYYAASVGGMKREMRHYNRARVYDVVRKGGKKILVKKPEEDQECGPTIPPYTDYHRILTEVHAGNGHGGRDRMRDELKRDYYIPKWAVETFLRCCPYCMRKKNAERTGVVVKPIISRQFNERCQVDLVDFQSSPDGPYKYLLHYQDHLTKFSILRPLQSKKATEVSRQLFSIFCIFGAPELLHSDNGREFVNSVVSNMVKSWPGCTQIHGRPRYPQSQGSVERANGDVCNMLRAVLAEWGTNEWARASEIVQWKKNTVFHRTIGRTPYEAVFGHPPPSRLREDHENNSDPDDPADHDDHDQSKQFPQFLFNYYTSISRHLTCQSIFIKLLHNTTN